MHISSHQQKAIKKRRQLIGLNDMPLRNKAEKICFKGFGNKFLLVHFFWTHFQSK
jgi:hypothetical protein